MSMVDQPAGHFSAQSAEEAEEGIVDDDNNVEDDKDVEDDEEVADRIGKLGTMMGQ